MLANFYDFLVISEFFMNTINEDTFLEFYFSLQFREKGISLRNKCAILSFSVLLSLNDY